MRYVVMCRVSGGFTGFREAELKEKEGRVRFFVNREDAQAVANDLTSRMNHRYSTASFRYWVEER